MTRRDTVLVGIDGTAPSLQALDWAAAYARRTGRSLHLVCSYQLPDTHARGDWPYAHPLIEDCAVRRRVEQVLEEGRERAERAGVPASTELAAGEPTGVLVERSAEHALVVVGARSAGRVAERLLGTVSATLPAHAHCPTVVVPSRHHPVRRGAPAARLEAPRHGRVVVGVDGSPGSEAALHHAVQQARAWRSSLLVVRAVPTGTWRRTPWQRSAVRDDLVSVARDDLAGVTGRLGTQHPDVPVEGAVVEATAPGALLEKMTSADLLVVGSRGIGGFRGLLLGSTCQQVLHRAHCPVLVARPVAGHLPAEHLPVELTTA